MDAEIRPLIYTPRSAGALETEAPGIVSLFAALPQLRRKTDLPGQGPTATIARLEARIAALEAEQAESERQSREALAAARDQAAQTQAVALEHQQDALERTWVARLEGTLACFQHTQSEYFSNVEREVVRLALAVAARVLHREAQMDPLLLRGPVRVALDDMQQNATCVLEVSTETAAAWEGWLSGCGATAAQVQLRAKESASPGHCRLEIDSSVADLSTSAQLAEIERGFFDLLHHRPVVANEVEQ